MIILQTRLPRHDDDPSGSEQRQYRISSHFLPPFRAQGRGGSDRIDCSRARHRADPTARPRIYRHSARPRDSGDRVPLGTSTSTPREARCYSGFSEEARQLSATILTVATTLAMLACVAPVRLLVHALL